jgi:hypothetical protein
VQTRSHLVKGMEAQGVSPCHLEAWTSETRAVQYEYCSQGSFRREG